MSFIIGNRDRFWPDLKVPFEIPESDFPAGSVARQVVFDAIKIINHETKVQLFDRKGRSDISDYIEYHLAEHLDDKGDSLTCSSPVGRQGGKQVILCDAGKVKTVLHETCHSLGLRHEHQRPDRDDFIKVDPSKIPSSLKWSNFEILDDLMFGGYDEGSIMHYNVAGVSSKDGKSLGNTSLSEADIRGINSMLTGGYLGTEFDKSTEAIIRVQSIDGETKVKKGDFTRIFLPSNRFWWYSGDSREWTTAPPGTNKIFVYHKRNSRDINWYCYQDPSVKIPHRRFLGDEHDKCGETFCKVFGVDTVSVAKGETKEVRVTDRHFKWRCGDSNENSIAPEGTDIIMVTRASTGGDITWACYKEGQ